MTVLGLFQVSLHTLPRVGGYKPLFFVITGIAFFVFVFLLLMFADVAVRNVSTVSGH